MVGRPRTIERPVELAFRFLNRVLSEEQAHQALRKLAMDRKRKLIDIADDLIAMSKLLS